MELHAIVLEDSDGNHQNNPSEDRILSTLEKIGGALEHCILHLGDAGFIQTAGSKDRLLIQYSDASGMYESTRSDFDAVTVGRIFIDAMNGGTGWKTEHNFTPMDAPGGSGSQDGVGRSESRSVEGGGQKRSLKDQLFDAVKKETQSGIGRLIRKGTKGFFGKKL
jgi:hypothetical protein